jgi:hypothetical protein
MINFENNSQDCVNEWADFCMLKLSEANNDCQASAMARNIPQEVAFIQMYDWFHGIGRDLLVSLSHAQNFKLDDMPENELKDKIRNLKKDWDLRIQRHRIEYDFLEKNQQTDDGEGEGNYD